MCKSGKPKVFLNYSFIIILIVLCLFFGSCSSVQTVDTRSDSSGEAVIVHTEEREAVDRFIQDYAVIVRMMNLEEIMSFFTDDAIITLLDTNGSRRIISGKNRIEDFHKVLIQDNPDLLQTFYISQIEGFYRIDERVYEACAFSESRPICYGFSFRREQSGDLKISRLLFDTRYLQEGFSPSRFQEWADGDEDGILSVGKQKDLVQAIEGFIMGYNEIVLNGLGEFFDFKEGGIIDDTERRIGRMRLLPDALRKYSYGNPSVGNVLFPDGRNVHAGLFIVFFLHDTPEDDPVRFLRTASDEFLDQVMDLDRDGYIHAFEIDVFMNLVLRLTAFFPDPPLYTRYSEGSKEEILEWADMNGDGIVMDVELTDLAWSLCDVQLDWEWMDAESPVHRFFDFNGDFILDREEQLVARSFIYDFLFRIVHERNIGGYIKSSAGKQSIRPDLDGNGRYEKAEREALEEYLKNWGREPGPAETAVEKIADRNRDGMVDWMENEDFATLGFTAALLAWMEMPKDVLTSFRADPQGFLRRETGWDRPDEQSYAVDSAVRESTAAGNESGIVRLGIRTRKLTDEMKGSLVAVTGITNNSTLIDDGTSGVLLFFYRRRFCKYRIGKGR